MKLQHIGYFNEVEDLKMFADASADEIVYGKKGNFFSVDDFTFYGEDDIPYWKDLQFTKDNKFAVYCDLPIDLSLLGKESVCDFFIDVYEVVEEDENPTEKLCAKSAVSGQIVNMLINNIINGYGNETFEGWCEDGVVFETAYPNATKEFVSECNKLMKEVAPLVDKLTYDYLAN
jgi:hypothetical protein